MSKNNNNHKNKSFEIKISRLTFGNVKNTNTNTHTNTPTKVFEEAANTFTVLHHHRTGAGLLAKESGEDPILATAVKYMKDGWLHDIESEDTRQFKTLTDWELL